MKNKINNKGITLLALVVTIIVLLILASIVAYNGIDMINSSKLTVFTTEMKLMQTEVNAIYDKWKDGDSVLGKTGDEILTIGKDISTVSQQASLVFQTGESGITDNTGYRYFDSETIQALKIDGVEQEFFVNISKRSVISFKGLKYDDVMYYTLKQLPDGFYNVEYENKNEGKVPTFDVTSRKVSENKWEITVSNIQFDGNIEKWKVKYKKEGRSYWKTSETFIVDSEGTYDIVIFNNDIISNEKTAVVGIIEPESIEIGGTAFSREIGQIEINFLEGTTYRKGNANAPLIDEDEMIPVNWNGTNWVVTDQTNWDYSYGATDTTKKWANVMLKDTLVLDGMSNEQVQEASIADMEGKTVTTEGSMLVWLPRYAYRIVYFNSSESKNLYKEGNLTEDVGVLNGSIVGYSDARGLVDSTGKTPTGMSTPVTSIGVGKELLRPHPAFETDFSQGGWDTRLTGIWMGKFETTGKVNSKITIKPNTAAYTTQTIGTFYTEAQDLGIANSHMAKNSEWGAMAYLTESEYGRNGVAVTSNSTNTITGQGDYKTKTVQSTTGNIYGIYDTAGGSYEWIASYIADSSRNYGNSFASTNSSASEAKNDKTESTKFATVYEMSDVNSYEKNYIANTNKKFGDATIETSTNGTSTTAWYSALSNFVGKYYTYGYPFFERSGYYGSTNAGTFYFSGYNGSKDDWYSFRVCASVQ